MQARDITISTFERLGVPIASHKTEDPATTLTFLGIQIDTVSAQLSLPPDKVMCLWCLLGVWMNKKSCTYKELESFLGHLSHATTVTRQGRIFLRQLFSLLQPNLHPHHFVRLNTATRPDIRWWQSLLRLWNGCSFFPPPTPSIHIYSDASGSFGCGAFVQEVGCFQLQWPSTWTPTEITAKELAPIVVAPPYGASAGLGSTCASIWTTKLWWLYFGRDTLSTHD